MASISSVAQVKAISRTKDSTGGNCLEIDCGQKNDIAPCSADYGTTIHVRDLFYKLPARRKFLKTANTEMSHITEYFTRIALANVDLDMTLVHNGKEIYRLPANQNFRQRIAALFSRQVSEGLIETETNEKGTGIFALLGKPSISKTNSKGQYIFLNGRFIRDKFISHAIKEAYRGNLEPNRFPVIFLFVQMAFEDYDVNVHPTKIEVRFYNANLLHSQILGTLREKLLATNLSVDAKLSQNHDRGQQIQDAMSDFFKKHRPAPIQHQIDFSRVGGSAKERFSYEPSQQQFELHAKRTFMQIQDSFIIAQTDDGFIIVDQHALHERIMYENLRKRISAGNLESQKLLIPESFEISEAHAEILQTNADLLEKLGIELAAFGPKTMAIQAFPSLLTKASVVDFMQDLIDLLADSSIKLDAERLLDAVLNMAACKAAIKAGQKLSNSEIEQLLRDKDITECSNHCPHGRPTTIKFSISDLEKQFKRT